MGVLRNIVVLAALVALILAGQKAWIYYSGPPANSTRTAGGPNETQHQVDRCVNEGNSFTPDDSISGCTAAIQSGRWSGQDLAAVFLPGQPYVPLTDRTALRSPRGEHGPSAPDRGPPRQPTPWRS